MMLNYLINKGTNHTQDIHRVDGSGGSKGGSIISPPSSYGGGG